MGDKGGESKHLLLVNEMPEHNHSRGTWNITGELWGEASLSWYSGHPQGSSGAFSTGGSGTAASATQRYSGPNHWYFNAVNGWSGEMGKAGNGEAFSVVQPYETIIIYKRIN